MSVHTRPLPTVRIAIADPQVPSPSEARVDPPATPAPSVADAQPATEPRPAVAPRTTTARSWYRREPWLAVMIAAFAPISVGFWLPQGQHLLLLAVSALLLVLSVAMLVRQGPFREHPGADAGARSVGARRVSREE